MNSKDRYDTMTADQSNQTSSQTYTRAQVDTALLEAGNNPDATDSDIRRIATLQIEMSISGVSTVDDETLDAPTSRLLAHFTKAAE